MSEKDPEIHRTVIGRWHAKVHEINHRYATPRIQMTRGIATVLLLLRLYLIFLVILLAYKFFLILQHPGGGI